MVKEILQAAGVTYRQGRFLQPPADTYAVYFDDVDVDGADPVPTDTGLPQVEAHSVRVEVYEPKPDPETEQAIESALRSRGLPWSKEDRVWLQDTQRYQVLYELEYYTKN